MSKKQFRTLASPAAAREAIADLELAGGRERVSLADARGRVLAERIDATLDVPGFDRASMDGYAVRAGDTVGADEADPVTLELAGAVHAGAEPDVRVADGSCIEVSTGAVMPPGADAVVVVERTDELDGGETTQIEVRTAVAPGENVMAAGTDIAAGARALGPGTRLTPREIGLLSALGVSEVPVRARPRVGIISTGDELVRPGEPVDSERGQIYDVNSNTIAAGVEAAGGEAVVYPHAGDDVEAMERLLRAAAADCDLVVSSGSTSASAVDVIYRVIEEQGELLLHGVAVKPGKPMLVGRIDHAEAATGSGGTTDDSADDADATDATDDATDGATDGVDADANDVTDGAADGVDDAGGQSAYIGLPGYPVSALTIFRTFVAPAIRAAAGLPEPETATLEGRMAGEVRHPQGRLRLMPVGLVDTAAGEHLVYPVDKGSGATTSLVEADGVLAVDPDTDYLAADERVSVRLFSPEVRPPTLLGIGEDDPALNELLDLLERPRYLPLGSREGLRRLRNGLPDLAVVAGEADEDSNGVDLGGWHREWGLLVPAGNPDGVESLGDLVDRDVRFVNRPTTSGLRRSLSNALSTLAAERGVSRGRLVESIEGFSATVNAFESPAGRIADGRAAVGLGLRTTADTHDLGFVSLGDQPVRLLGNPERLEKPAFDRLESALAALPARCGSLSGYRFSGE